MCAWCIHCENKYHGETAALAVRHTSSLAIPADNNCIHREEYGPFPMSHKKEVLLLQMHFISFFLSASLSVCTSHLYFSCLIPLFRLCLFPFPHVYVHLSFLFSVCLSVVSLSGYFSVCSLFLCFCVCVCLSLLEHIHTHSHFLIFILSSHIYIEIQIHNLHFIGGTHYCSAPLHSKNQSH